MATKRRNFPVQGMGCAACVARVEGALKACKGVQDVAVSLASNQARVDYDSAVCTPADLQKAVRDAGYDMLVDGSDDEAESEAERAREDAFRRLKRDTVVALVLAAVEMLLSMGFEEFPGRGFILAAIATALFGICIRHFFKPGFKGLFHGGANMDTLVSLSVTIAYLFSLFNLLFPQVWTSRGLEPHLYFDSCTMIVAFVLLGRLLEEKAKQGTAGAIRGLMGLQPRTVTVQRVEVSGGVPLIREEELPVESVVPGDVLVVKPGARIPVDGTVSSGESYVDESMLTGEPVPALKTSGMKVYSGTINQRGSLNVRAEKVGESTLLSGIIRMVRDAQGSKAPIQRLVDRIAAVFVPVIIGISLLTLLCWIFLSPGDGVTMGLLAMVAVLLIACPCALGLATPTAIIAGIGNGASKGILIKDAESLQVARKINAIVLDKTGTLTEGKPSVVESVWDPDVTAEDDPSVLNLRDVLFSLESQSNHPLAGAVVDSLRGCDHLPVEHFEAVLGKGISGEVAGVRYYAGNQELLRDVLGDVPEATSPMIRQSITPFLEAGYTLTLFFDKQKVHALLALSDELKDTSVRAVRELQDKGVEVHMLTGDGPVAADHIARETGITHVHANVLPQDKALYVKELQQSGKCVAMVGDGINDSAALAQSDLGIAMGQGSDIAMDSAGVTLVSSDLSRIGDLISLSRRTVRIIRQNLFWAFFYNLLMIPLAAGVLYPWTGWLLSPMVAAACMALSSVCVVTNSLRLRK